MLRSTVTSSGHPARWWRQRALVASPTLRAAIIENGHILGMARQNRMKETIYDREPTDRPLSGNLMMSEYVQDLGDGVQVGNTAPYAAMRNDLEGTSKLYGHDMYSHWADWALAYTRPFRAANTRAALRTIINAPHGGTRYMPTTSYADQTAGGARFDTSGILLRLLSYVGGQTAHMIRQGGRGARL